MSKLSPHLVRRVGIWALIQALPGETELRAYLRAAYLGLTGVIIGSVLTGSTLAAGMIALYRLLLGGGLGEGPALLLTSGMSILLIMLCFLLAGRWFKQLVHIKEDMSLFNDVGHDVLSGALNALTEGFLEGVVLSARQPDAEKDPTRATG